MKHTVLVKKLSDTIEEEITISVNGIDITCFMSVCSVEVKEYNTYTAFLDIEMFDDELSLSEITVPTKEMLSVGSSFGYIIKGLFANGILDAGITFDMGEEFKSEYSYLNNKYIQLKADRINIEFI